MKIPLLLHYTAEHLWVQESDDGNWLAGITDYAQDLLGDIVYLEMPKIGNTLIAQQSCGLVESVKTGSELYAPMNGVVTEVNEALTNMPEAINDNPYQSWIFKFKPVDIHDTEHLLTAEAYAKLVE
jgi:glycine cleavage system H protein